MTTSNREKHIEHVIDQEIVASLLEMASDGSRRVSTRQPQVLGSLLLAALSWMAAWFVDSGQRV